MDKYLEVLAKQYIKAKGIRTKMDLNDPKFMEDLLFWIRERNEIGNKYTSYLESLDIDFDRVDCAEIGKSELDTVVAPYDTTIVTPVSKYIYNVEKERIINASFMVDNKKPYFVINGKSLQVAPYHFDTFMTQNVYSMNELANWADLHNSYNGKIIVGAYGSLSDKDIYPVLNHIQLFQDKLEGDILYDYTMMGDSYLVVAASKASVKEKVLTR